MVIMLSIQGMAYVKSAKILIANLVQVKSTGHQTKQKWFTVTSPPGRLATSKLATKGDLATTKSPPVDSPPRVISYIALVTLVTGLLDEIYLSNRRS